jgi:hypothetical protein
MPLPTFLAAGEECRSGAECGLCFARRTRPGRSRYNGCKSPDPWAPLTAGQWRSILGPVARYEREGGDR